MGLVKQSLRKRIGLKGLSLDQFVVEVEELCKTQPLTYIYIYIYMMIFSLTPANFLNANLRSFPLMDTKVDYSPSEDSMMTLLSNWRKGQKQLNMFWDMWKNTWQV